MKIFEIRENFSVRAAGNLLVDIKKSSRKVANTDAIPFYSMNSGYKNGLLIKYSKIICLKIFYNNFF